MAIIEHASDPLRKASPRDPSLRDPSLCAPATRSTLRRDGPAVFEAAGTFEIRLAVGPHDVRQAQELRFEVFFGEGGAVAAGAAARLRRDICPLDGICDHLVVVDTAWRDVNGASRPKLVGTYRLLRRAVAERHGGFYSQNEFELAPLLHRHPRTRFLELGRSCVHPHYRSRRVIELLWRGLWLYAQHHGVDCLIGCASLPGADLDANRAALSFLRHHAPASAAWDVAPLPGRAAAFIPLAREAVDLRRGLAALPPLVKAYLRTGARFGSGVVLDHQFGTTDVFAVMPMADIEDRYLAHYGQPSCLSGAPVA